MSVGELVGALQMAREVEAMQQPAPAKTRAEGEPVAEPAAAADKPAAAADKSVTALSSARQTK
jgi:hypothetical protein